MKLWVLFEFVLLALLSPGCRLTNAQNASRCGSISVSNLVANVGSNYNVTCSFCRAGAADQVQWEYGGTLLPNSHYTKVNSNVSLVTLVNLRLTSRKGRNLTCMSEEESYTALIQTGYPPDVPRDVKCVTQNFVKLVCSWNPGRDTNIETSYSSCQESSNDCKQVGTANFVELDFFIFEALILRISAVNHLGRKTSESFRMEESDFVFMPYTPELLRVFKGPSDFQLTVEWNEGGAIYDLDLNIIFQIQVLQTYKMQEVWMGNYSSTLDFTRNRTLQLTWTSDMPLQCTSHSVRIRCIGNDSDFLFTGVRAWSDWSPLLTLDGQDVSNQTNSKVYPVDGTVLKAGSSLAFCCVAEEGNGVEELSYGSLNLSTIALSKRSQAVRVQNISPSIQSGTNVVCVLSSGDYIGAVIYVGYPPDTPGNLSCETRDLQTLNCTWDPGRLTGLTSQRSTIYILIEGSSQNSLPCEEATRIYPYYWCGFPISNGSGIHNITINAKNPLGEAQSSTTVDVTRVFHPFAPHQLRQEVKTSESVTVSWSDKVDYTGIGLLCEMVISGDWGRTMSHNYSVTGGPTDARHTVILNNLRANTGYSIRARYLSQHFWKWSEWSNVLNVTTEQAAPSVSLDVWRTIMPDRTVTIYWKPLSATDANGPVLSYNITWTKVGSDSKSTIATSKTSAQIHLDRAGYVVTVVAQNSAGMSPPSKIRIPPQQDDENLDSEKASGTGDGFNVTWQRHQAQSCGYTVQWCNFPSSPVCNLDWQKFPSNSTRATIKSDAFQTGVRYNLDVLECRDDGDYLLKRQVGYTRELAPSEAPKLDIKETTEDSVKIEWNEIPVEKRRGFIEGFKVYYRKLYNDSAAIKPMGTHWWNTAKPKTINNSDTRAFKITGLESGTTYSVAVSAYTGGGDSPRKAVTVTTPNSSIALILGITLPLVGIIALGVMLSIFCYRKQEWIKETFYPEIPDPNNSKVLQDGNFLQGVNSCKTLEPKDCTPNKVQVVEEKQIIAEDVKEDKDEDVPEDASDMEHLAEGVLSYSPQRASTETSGETNPAFEASLPSSPSVHPSEVTYTILRGPGYHQQEAPETEPEEIVKSGYQPQIHAATNLATDQEQPEVKEITPHGDGYQPQMHHKSWSLDSGDFPPPETESIGSPTSINSQAFLIPEKMLREDDGLKPSGRGWPLSFFNSEMSSNSFGNSNNS
ncbi:LIF receptor subunit alpha a [Heptranchias perlo]|uniref:LIF receptor subunit alpha a n=1 Tax=Heptranchias perlo TaxID=212740 RepID=UPI00355A64B6